ncbi:MAG: aminotransferase class V-fold PLP-dependent enzyme [Candidatus Sumerlaeia bacterium]|nr:aminotransferase class V-fold PLP-dependent enzyme [Candidatus Sumerlaeia bacterium]
MKKSERIVFKIATEESEFDQIFRLNYRTFVEEIPQHKPNPDGKLVDRFHPENTYIICLVNGTLVGMVCCRAKRPFSLDSKLPNLDSYLPPGRHPVEIRLLSVEKDHRRGHIFYGLMVKLMEYCKKQGYDLAIISGTTRQLKLYQHLGFTPFGPLVGTADALYQPMYLTREVFERKMPLLLTLAKSPARPGSIVNLLPGPVGIRRKVRKAFASEPVSHRSESFMETMQETRRMLCRLTHSAHVQILTGSGTLANDAIAGQLSLLDAPGLILSNGEFGSRLIDQARRFRLTFDTLERDWGEVFEPADIIAAVERNPRIRWLWAVHCETSTGVLNDLNFLKNLCAERGIHLCMDCISSIGTTPVDLRGVYLASGVSGKGIASFPGLALVFHNHSLTPAPDRLPSYLDLGVYQAKKGVPYTISSNLIHALHAALTHFDAEEFFKAKADLCAQLRARLREMGFTLVAPEEHSAPAVITIALPPDIKSMSVGRRAKIAGYLLSYRSEYLLKRNWIQICLMGEYSKRKVLSLLKLLRGLCEPALETA